MSDLTYATAKICALLIAVVMLAGSSFLALTRLSQHQHTGAWLILFTVGLLVLWGAGELGAVGDSPSYPSTEGTAVLWIGGVALAIIAVCFVYSAFDWGGIVVVGAIFALALSGIGVPNEA